MINLLLIRSPYKIGCQYVCLAHNTAQHHRKKWNIYRSQKQQWDQYNIGKQYFWNICLCMCTFCGNISNNIPHFHRRTSFSPKLYALFYQRMYFIQFCFVLYSSLAADCISSPMIPHENINLFLNFTYNMNDWTLAVRFPTNFLNWSADLSEFEVRLVFGHEKLNVIVLHFIWYFRSMSHNRSLFAHTHTHTWHPMCLPWLPELAHLVAQRFFFISILCICSFCATIYSTDHFEFIYSNPYHSFI